MSECSILAAGLRYFPMDEQPRDLLALLREEEGRRLRRSNRYIALSLLGALACVRGQQLAEDCGVYLGSGLGNVAETVAMFGPVLDEGLAPMPFGFINVSSNMAGFTLAQQLGLHGRNLALANAHNPFAAALACALRDLHAGRVSQALVGAVDEGVWPLAVQRQRLGLAEEASLGEGSGWILLGNAAGIGRLTLTSLSTLPSPSALSETILPWPGLEQQFPDDVPTHLPTGQSPSLGAWRFIETISRANDAVVGLSESGQGGYWQLRYQPKPLSPRGEGLG